MIIEKRTVHELRAESQGDEMALVGYASKFNVESSDLGNFREIVMPGAFARSIREGADVRFLMNHSPDKVMGRTKNGTLKIEEDGIGLKFRCVLPNTQDARDLHTLVKRGDVDSCSFAFIAKDQSWEDTRSENGDMYAVRKLMDVDLQDCSAVTYPAYPATEVSARHLFGTDEMPVEIRSAIKTLEAKRSGDKGGVEISSMIQSFAEKAGAHDVAANDHEKKALAAFTKGDQTTAQAQYDASESHASAKNANVRAIVGYASKCPMCDMRAKSATIMSGKAADKSILAGAKRSDEDDAEKRAAGQPLAIESYSISLPQPFGEKEKGKWCDAYMDALKDALKRQKLRYQDAVAYAFAQANKDFGVSIQTEVTPAVAGQGKDPSELPHEVIKTDAERAAEAEAEERKKKDKAKTDIADSDAATADAAEAERKKKEEDTNTAIAPSGVPVVIADDNGEDPDVIAKKNKEGRGDDDRVAAVSDPDSADYDPEDPDYDPAYDEERKKAKADNPDGKAKDTKDEERSAEDEGILMALRAQARLIEIDLE